MLHVATHGVYAPESRNRIDARAEPSHAMFVDGKVSPPLPPPWSEDPADGLDRAGLAMAGANQGAAGIVTVERWGV